MQHIFNHTSLTEWLNVDITPSAIESQWAMLAGKVKKSSFFGIAKQGPSEEAFAIRLRQNGDDKERLYVGDEHVHSREGLRAGDVYYRIATGADGHKSGSLEIGLLEGEFHPIPFRAPDVHATPALRMHFNYTDTKAVRVSMILRDESGSARMLGLGRPQNDEQAKAALRMMGEAINNISQGHDVDFGLIHMILKDHGLVDYKTPAPSLLANSTSIAIVAQNIFGRLTA